MAEEEGDSTETSSGSEREASNSVTPQSVTPKDSALEDCLRCGLPGTINSSEIDFFWNVPLSLYITDTNGNFIGFNEEFLELFGYTREEMANVKSPDLYVDTKDRYPLLDTLVKTGEINDYEVRLKRKDREERICKIGAVVRKTETGNVLYYGFIRDITDRRQLHEAAEKNAALEASVRTAVGMTHDFNNILTAILGNVALATSLSVAITSAVAEHKELETILGDKPEELTEKLEIIKGASERAKELVQRLNGYTVTDKPEILDVNQIATDVVSTMSSLAAKLGYHLNYELKTDRFIFAHTIQIYRIISNLVQNAGEAITNASVVAYDTNNSSGQTNLSNQTNSNNQNNPTNGNVTIVTQNVDIPTIFGSHGEIPEGSYVLLSVSDNGPGIQSVAMEKIFEPYFTTKSNGTGLGLFNVWKIVSDYNGHINVLTRTEPKGERGTGTTFQIYLPRAEAVKLTESIKETTRETQTPLISYSNLNILVVDNESVITALLEVHLQGLNHNPTIVTNAEEALRLYELNNYDLVISDVNMPGMSGLELCKRITAQKPEVRFCLMSGYFEAENVTAFSKLGVIGYLKKPFNPQTVEELIKSAMAHQFAKRDSSNPTSYII